MVTILSVLACLNFVINPFVNLNIIFKSCLTQGIFLSEWEKANVVPIHKKITKSSVLKTTDVLLCPNL